MKQNLVPPSPTALNPAPPPAEELRQRPPVERGRSRRTNGTAHATSGRAVDITDEDLHDMTAEERHAFLVEAAFGDETTVVCSHCQSIDKHVWSATQRRWRCRACGKRFSLTSGSILANTKIPQRRLISHVFKWLAPWNGRSALEIRRELGGRPLHVFVRGHKLRQAVAEMHNIGLTAGVQEMDGVHLLGRDAAGKRNKPQGGGVPEVDPADLTESEREAYEKRRAKLEQSQSRQNADKASGKSRPPAKYPERRRIGISASQRDAVRGAGASATRIGVARSEREAAVTAVGESFIVEGESELASDAWHAYAQYSRERFDRTSSVEHSLMLVGTEGQNINQGENLARRAKAVEKVYMRIDPKYLHEYAVEAAFRKDLVHMTNGERLRYTLSLAFRTRVSPDFVNYCHGSYRIYEVLADEGLVETPHHRPARGAHPNSQINGRPPR